MKLKHFGGYFTSMNEISLIILFPCSILFVKLGLKSTHQVSENEKVLRGKKWSLGALVPSSLWIMCMERKRGKSH